MDVPTDDDGDDDMAPMATLKTQPPVQHEDRPQKQALAGYALCQDLPWNQDATTAGRAAHSIVI